MRGQLVIGLVVAMVFGGLSHALKVSLQVEREFWPPEAEYHVLPPPETAPYLAVGYRELAADITWSRTLVYYGSSRVGWSDFRYLERFIDNVLALDPRFKRVYRWAAYSVTYKKSRIEQDEVLLSMKYLERAIEAYPDDYEYYWLLGLRLWLDVIEPDPDKRHANLERAAALIETAMRKPNAPARLPTLAASLRTRMGQRERALRDLREMIMTTDHEGARAAMIQRYGEITGRYDVADALAEARAEFDDRWQQHMPFAPASLFVIFGPRPAPVIEFDELATERDLFVIDDELMFDTTLLSPMPEEPMEMPAQTGPAAPLDTGVDDPDAGGVPDRPQP